MFARVLVIVAVAVSVNALLHISVFAQEFNWAEDEITVERRSDLSTDPSQYGFSIRCTNQNVLLPNVWGYYEEMEYCVYQAKSFKYVIYEGRIYLNLSGGNAMYPLLNWGTSSASLIPGTDDLILSTYYLKDVPHNIESNNDAYHPGYIALPEFGHLMSMDENRVNHSTNYTTVSENGRWLVLNFMDIGYVRIDASNMTAKWVAPHRSVNEFIVISNDGNTIASITWGYDPIRIYSLENCGEDADILQSSWFAIDHPSACQPRDVSSIVNTALGSMNHTSPAIPRFNNAGTELTVFVRPNHVGGEGIILKVANNTTPSSHLDYLALGDSYSSGEGDLGINPDGWPYYTYLSRGVGGCHISTRSYPFILARLEAISSERMQSVACSGARVANDYYGSSGNYLGQHNQLAGKSLVEVAAEQSNALSNFAPGLLKQLDFVRDNKPKVVTVTGGGNDVGFGKLMRYCAVPSVGGERHNTCDQAVAGTLQRSMLGDSIQGQYDKIVALIRSIKEASETTMIYVVGYPSFVSDAHSTCLNSGALNQAERRIINESVSYMNKILLEASKSAGARYVDVESSLDGGRICEGSEYMTGVLDALNIGISEHASEMFHPNSKGHEKMAAAIRNGGFTTTPAANPLATETHVPIKPAAFGAGAYIPTVQAKLVDDGIIFAGEILKFSVSPRLYAVNSNVNFTIHSKAKKLGSYETQQDGAINKTIKIPHSIKPGYHMIVAEGESANGGLLRLYQFVEVRRNVGNDRDGDGIKDDKDKCHYIEHWYNEATKKNICAL